MKHPLDAVGTAGSQGKITTREYDPAAQFERAADCRLPTPARSQSEAPGRAANSRGVKFTPQLIACADCHELFTWTSGEQEFFAAQGFQTPKRCRPCRGKKREKYARKF